MTPAELLALADAATPGPWLVREDDCAVETQDLRALVLMDDRANPDDRVQAEATTRLIALAPDLARLCAEMGEAVDLMEATFQSGGDLWWKAHEDAFAALAKLSELEAR